jgi:hypothetical protein
MSNENIKIWEAFEEPSGGGIPGIVCGARSCQFNKGTRCHAPNDKIELNEVPNVDYGAVVICESFIAGESETDWQDEPRGETPVTRL